MASCAEQVPARSGLLNGARGKERQWVLMTGDESHCAFALQREEVVRLGLSTPKRRYLLDDATVHPVKSFDYARVNPTDRGEWRIDRESLEPGPKIAADEKMVNYLAGLGGNL